MIKLLKVRYPISCIFNMVLLAIIFDSCSVDTARTIIQRKVTDIEARKALDLSLTKLDAVYYWGGDGPDKFDCSGLIVWSYQEVLSEEYIFTDGAELVNDVTMDTLYHSNVNQISRYEIKPGDIIFISNTDEYITHGGIISEVKDYGIVFINASSFFNKVVIDEWNYDGKIRDQWIVGFGRILISH